MLNEKESSTFKVPLTTIIAIKPHTNADSLEFAQCYGFDVVVKKGKYKVNDVVLYIPIDSILPQALENRLFPPGSKIILNKHRIRQIKIRGQYSQGMIIDPYDIVDEMDFQPDLNFTKQNLENDFSKALNITKYEPPAPSYQTGLVRKRDKPLENPYLHKYGGLDNFKWYPDLFEEGEIVSVTEKIHGSNIRFGYVPFTANTPFKKLLKFLKLNPSHEFCYGSNNVQLQQRTKWWRTLLGKKYTGFYGGDVYGKVLEKYDVRNKVNPGEVYYGELYGDGIQKDYKYGCKNGEHRLVVFDLKLQSTESSDYISVDNFRDRALKAGFQIAPELYRGPFNKDLIKSLTLGNSVLEPSQKVREGVVVKPITEIQCSIGRKVLKVISEKYLEGDQSDYH